MAEVISTDSLAKSITSRTNKDRDDLIKIGKELDAAEGDFNKVVNNEKSNPGQIEAAKQDYEKQIERFKTKVAMMDTVNRIIDQIIQRIGQVGR